MKKIFIITFSFLLLPMFAIAWDDCPFGLENDPYPGACGCYVDTNNDGICDHSQQLVLNSEPIVAVETAEKEDSTEHLGNKNQAQKQNTGSHKYWLWQIFSVLTILYVITYILSKKQKIHYVTHKKLWNILLTVFFVISGLVGILLVIRINYKIDLNLPINLLKLHVETGIAMAVISVFHIFWHLTYYKNIFKSNKK